MIHKISGLLVGLAAVGALMYWRIDDQVQRSGEAAERQPAEQVVHARRMASAAFAWQPELAAAQALLRREAEQDPSSLYLRRSRDHVTQGRRGFLSFWKVAGLAGFFAFALGVVAAISSSGRRRLWLGLSAGVGFAVFVMGMALL